MDRGTGMSLLVDDRAGSFFVLEAGDDLVAGTKLGRAMAIENPPVVSYSEQLYLELPRQQIVQVEFVDEGSQVPPCHAANFCGLPSEELTESLLNELDVAWALGRRFSSIAERMVSLGEDAFTRYEMQGGPSCSLCGIHGEIGTQFYGS